MMHGLLCLTQPQIAFVAAAEFHVLGIVQVMSGIIILCLTLISLFHSIKNRHKAKSLAADFQTLKTNLKQTSVSPETNELIGKIEEKIDNLLH